MSTFALDTASTTQNVIDAINYAVSNLGQGGSASFNGNVLTANTATGQITTTTTNAAGYSNTSVISYLYQFIYVQYANTATGGGFTSNCRNTQYYGLYNTNSTTIDTNPTDYIWYQVTNGFGTTKNLWYQTTGGRQVAFFAGNAAPAPNYIAVPDNTPLNLDSITSVQNNQIVNVNAYYQANIAPATPSGGTYNFSTFTLTPPTGWSATIPSTNSNTTVYVSQAAFVGNSISTVGPATLWTTPAAYIQQFQGNTGPAGQRGFIPMGYVICSTDPAFFSNPTDYSNAFAAARTNASPPIGLGFSPIANDTAQFFYANLFSGTNTTTVRQFNGNIWINVDAQVISGGLFVPGTITANTLNANQVYALTITGGNVTPGVNSGYGYWLTANVGNAYFGGTVDIGNNLIVGQNAQFGSNLNVGTNATIGANATVGDSLSVANNATIGNNLLVGTNATIGGVIIGGALAAGTVGNTQVISGLDGGLLATGTVGSTQIGNNAIITGKISANAVTAGTISANAISSYSLQANSVVAGTIAANAVTTGTIAANTITGNLIQANTIQGTSIVAGSITSTQLSANIIISGNIISFGQTIEQPTGTGYWLDYTNGNVYFGGNTVIGNSLKIGNNPNIGTGLTVGASAVIGANLTVGFNANVGANLTVGANATIGSNLTVGTSATIGANLSVGRFAAIGSNLSVGDSATIGNNVSIGNYLSVGNQATIGGVIIGGILAAGTVGNVQIVPNLNGGLIAGGTIGTTQIASNAITTGLIAANAITAGLIAANSIYAGAIQANAVTAGTIAANSIYAGAIQANAVTAGTVAANAITSYSLAANAVTAGTISANAISSYSLRANAVIAGTIAANAISAYSLQANSVTGNAINANTITTTNLVFNSQTGQTSKGPDQPGTYVVPFVNGTSNVQTSSGYLWPYNTRGLAIEGGVSYIPTTTGNIQSNSTSYSHISVVYSGYIFGANTANLVEVWKAGGSAYYAQTFNQIKIIWPFGWSPAKTYDSFYVVGNNGFWGGNGNNGLAGSWTVVQAGGQSTNGSTQFQSLETYEYGDTQTTMTVAGVGGLAYGVGFYGNSFAAPYYQNGYVSNYTKSITVYDQAWIGAGLIGGIPNIIGVGNSGTIYHTQTFSGLPTSPASAIYETTNVLQTFYGVAVNQGPLSPISSNNVEAIAVGSNGTILQSTYTLNQGSSPTAGTWIQKVSNTLNDFYSVASNASYNGTTSGSIQWVAVGQYGTIATSPDGNTWTLRTSGTTQNLNGVAYGNGYWVAVGNNSTVVYSTDGINWSVTQSPIGNDGVYRNLTSIAYGYVSQSFNAVGQAIITRATNPATWSTTYDGGVSVTSTLTRLTTVGADGSNIANVTIPAQNQTIGSQQISGQYIDTNYTAGVTQTYYLVMGNLTGNVANIVSTNGATLVVTEFKR